MTERLFEFAGWLLLAAWVLTLGPGWFTHRRRLLRRVSAADDPDRDWPLVSIIVPARDEVGQIETTLRTLLALDYPHYEIIAIDDRSRDGTGAIIDRIADEDPRVRALHVRELPADWLGKNHALHLGAREARGEFLLFTDGDVVFQPDALTSVMKTMLDDRFDHICLIPQLVGGSYLERSLVVQFTLLFSAGIQPWLVSTPIKRFYAGIGAFNLVRRSAYDACGGHAAIRLDVLDDVKLGKMFKQNGFRQNILIPGDAVSVRWQSSAWGVIRGLEKNAFASVNYSLTLLVLFTLAIVVIELAPFAGAICLSGPARCGYVATLIFSHGYYAWAAAAIEAGWWTFPMMSVSLLGMLLAYWRSAVIALKNGGIRWRDTFYPLDLLRKNIY